VNLGLCVCVCVRVCACVKRALATCAREEDFDDNCSREWSTVSFSILNSLVRPSAVIARHYLNHVAASR
jgi:hypothetical protein